MPSWIFLWVSFIYTEDAGGLNTSAGEDILKTICCNFVVT